MIDRTTLNVIQVGFGFMFILMAFNAQGFIEETVLASVSASTGSINKHAGYYSLSIIYFVFTFANFIAAPIVETIGPRWSMVVGSACYTQFLAGFLFLNAYYLYFSSALLGFGAAVLWTGQGNYLALNSNNKTSGRNSAMLWGLMHLIIGGLFLYIAFHSTSDTIDNSTIHIVYGGFTVISLIGNIVLALLRIPSTVPIRQQQVVDANDDDLKIHKVNNPTVEIVEPLQKQSFRQSLGSTFRLMITKDMMLLSVVFMYSGIELSFWSGIYSTCLSFTKKFGENTNVLLAFNAMALGVGQILGGGLFGILAHKTAAKYGRDSIVMLGCVTHLITFLLIFINIPADAPLRKTYDTALIEPNVGLAIFCAFLLGFGDCCWNTQIYSILIALYRHHLSAQAFALMKFFQSLLTCAAFYYGSYLQLQWHLLILLLTSIAGACCFFAVERSAKRSAVDSEDNERIE